MKIPHKTRGKPNLKGKVEEIQAGKKNEKVQTKELRNAERQDLDNQQ